MAARSILAAIDGRESIDRLVGFAARRARNAGAPLLLCHVIKRVATGVLPDVPVYGSEPPAGIDDDSDALLALASARARQDGVEPRDTFVLEPPAATAIVDLAERERVDFIVMGTHGRHGFPRVLRGSVAEKVLRTGAAPTFVLHCYEKTLPPHDCATLQRLIVAIDRSAASTHAVEVALELARIEGAHLRFLNVVNWHDTYADTVSFGIDPSLYLLQARDESRRLLDEALTRAIARGSDASLVSPEGDSVTEILAEAKRFAADAIVMGTHGRTGLSRLFLGSVAEGVIREATVPVLTTPLHHVRRMVFA